MLARSLYRRRMLRGEWLLQWWLLILQYRKFSMCLVRVTLEDRMTSREAVLSHDWISIHHKLRASNSPKSGNLITQRGGDDRCTLATNRTTSSRRWTLSQSDYETSGTWRVIDSQRHRGITRDVRVSIEISVAKSMRTRIENRNLVASVQVSRESHLRKSDRFCCVPWMWYVRGRSINKYICANN